MRDRLDDHCSSSDHCLPATDHYFSKTPIQANNHRHFTDTYLGDIGITDLPAEQMATVRERLTAEIRALREEIASAFEDGLRQGRQREELAGCVRAIYNRKGDEMVERVTAGMGERFRVQDSGKGEGTEISDQ